MASSTEQGALDREAVTAVDRSDFVTDILAIPEHLRDALWKTESAGLTPWDSPGGVVTAGMGGSAIGGALARAILGDHASRPLLTANGYGLPPWTTDDTTVLCASYSGETEETLACYEAAGVIGARRVVVTSGGRLAEQAREDGVPVIPVAGGLQPRAAVAYLTVAALEVAFLAGAGPRVNSDIDVAAEHLEELVEQWGPDGDEETAEPKRLARAIHGTMPVIAGAGLTTPLAMRWKTQINENAKQPAYAVELPEADHNEIVAYESAPEFGRFSAVFLDDADTHPRIEERIALTGRIVGEGCTGGIHRVESRGSTAVERVFSLVLMGDLVSLYLAVLRGVDPTPVPAIERLKADLG
jgi:glucose/mannose-6-phosphate isomerase